MELKFRAAMENQLNDVNTRFRVARLARLNRLLFISVLTWCAFSLFSFVSGSTLNGTICGISAAVCMLLSPFCNAPSVRVRTWTSHALMAVCLLGIVAISVVTGESKSVSPIFLCAFGLFASHVNGIRASLVWTIICIAVIAVIGADLIGIEPRALQNPLNKTVHCIVLALFIFLINWQSQHYFKVQTDEMVKLTGKLEGKANALEKLAQFDSLTGLFNRHNFQRQVKVSMLDTDERGDSMALLLLDLDGFKEINDTLGHQMGDEILKHVAIRLKEVVASEQFVARLGGDEFTVILERVKDSEDIEQLGLQIIESLSRPFKIKDSSYSIGVSIGAAVYPVQSSSVTEMLAFADTAMYKSKSQKNGLVIYDSTMTTELIQRRELEARLSEALEAREFRLFFQPQINVYTSRIVGFEALLRWERDGTWSPPDEFISSLESSREIIEVGQWVLKSACLQAKEWHELGYPVRMAVNISPVQFQEEGFCDRVIDVLELTRLDPKFLELEITESTLILDVQEASMKIATLREMGVSTSIDDFGTGYSSLAYLRDLPISRLKIDRKFISEIPVFDDGTIARTIITLAKNLGMHVLAEGVESEEQLNFIRQAGCKDYQGFLHSQPMPRNQCLNMLKAEYSSKEFPLKLVGSSQADDADFTGWA